MYRGLWIVHWSVVTLVKKNVWRNQILSVLFVLNTTSHTHIHTHTHTHMHSISWSGWVQWEWECFKTIKLGINETIWFSYSLINQEGKPDIGRLGTIAHKPALFCNSSNYWWDLLILLVLWQTGKYFVSNCNSNLPLKLTMLFLPSTISYLSR